MAVAHNLNQNLAPNYAQENLRKIERQGLARNYATELPSTLGGDGNPPTPFRSSCLADRFLLFVIDRGIQGQSTQDDPARQQGPGRRRGG